MKVQEVIDKVTERVKDTANVKVVFGDPIEARDVTIIPVASVKFSGGGGGGMGTEGLENDEAEAAGHKGKGSGMGIGMQVTTSPVGYIEVRDGEATMVDIVDKNKLAMATAVTGGLLLLMFAKLFVWKAKHS